MPADDKNPQWRHQIVLTDREVMQVDGVLGLGSFDEREIAMETEQGALLIRGEELDIKQLNLDKGSIVIEGLIKLISYDDESRGKKGLLGRLLK
ncbi:MAG: sporulation protein YabP [Sporomusaceae bacterium]|nr:sporulation protein YabP [Sporomusaceae bacterium]